MTSYTDADIQEYIDYTKTVIAETYLMIKKAVSPHAATHMKKDMLQLREYALDRIGRMMNPELDKERNQEQGNSRTEELSLDKELSLADNKAFFKEMALLHCDAAITAQIRFSSKAFRATLTKDAILEKCKICGLDPQWSKQILKEAGFDEE